MKLRPTLVKCACIAFFLGLSIAPPGGTEPGHIPSKAEMERDHAKFLEFKKFVENMHGLMQGPDRKHQCDSMAVEKKGNRIWLITPKGNDNLSMEQYKVFLEQFDQNQYLKECESILKTLATGLEMYATDHKGKYPTSLSVLPGTYLPRLYT